MRTSLEIDVYRRISEEHSDCTHASRLIELTIKSARRGGGTTNDGGFEVLFSWLHDVSRPLYF